MHVFVQGQITVSVRGICVPAATDIKAQFVCRALRFSITESSGLKPYESHLYCIYTLFNGQALNMNSE